MWQSDYKKFADQNGIPRKLAKYLKCTAEHLIARCDDGQNSDKTLLQHAMQLKPTRWQGKKRSERRGTPGSDSKSAKN